MRTAITALLITAVFALAVSTPISARADDVSGAGSAAVEDALVALADTEIPDDRRRGPGVLPLSACKDIPPVHHRMYGIRTDRDEDGNENTIWGMNRTYEDGVRWFETDVQILLSEAEARAIRNGTYDGGHHGEMILFHDGTLKRTTRERGRIRDLTYDQLPLTSDGRRIPTLEDGIEWIAEHPGTHLLVEIKMKLSWRRVNDLLDEYGLSGTDRIIFDIAKVARDEDAELPGGNEKYETALKAAENLDAITGIKSWPVGKPASWLRQFGPAIRLGQLEAYYNLYALEQAGMNYRFSKVSNGTETRSARAQWAQMVQSGGFEYILTEKSKEYLEWCAEQQEET